MLQIKHLFVLLLLVIRFNLVLFDYNVFNIAVTMMAYSSVALLLTKNYGYLCSSFRYVHEELPFKRLFLWSGKNSTVTVTVTIPITPCTSTHLALT